MTNDKVVLDPPEDNLRDVIHEFIEEDDDHNRLFVAINDDLYIVDEGKDGSDGMIIALVNDPKFFHTLETVECILDASSFSVLTECQVHFFYGWLGEMADDLALPENMPSEILERINHYCSYSMMFMKRLD